jgi:hypothetical protein
MIEPAAFVDFVSDRSLEDLATELSIRLFGGIPFVGRDEGIWDEIPALRLKQRFLGLEVVLGGTAGNGGGYSLEALVANMPAGVPATERADLSEFLGHLLAEIDGVRVARIESKATNSSHK